ncbi:MAG: hemerythrin domain-containing protein [Gillisia sp.]
MVKQILKLLFFIILLFIVLKGCSKKEDPAVGLPVSGKIETPAVILQEHHYFLEKLEQATFYGDSTGYYARELYEVMEFHFKEEEDYVLPPLGILPIIAGGEFPKNAGEIILLTEKSARNSAVILAEHQMITHFLGQMMLAAVREGHEELSGFDEALHKHSALEEEVLFPMVVVIGDYLKLKQSGERKE